MSSLSFLSTAQESVPVLAEQVVKILAVVPTETQITFVRSVLSPPDMPRAEPQLTFSQVTNVVVSRVLYQCSAVS